MPTSLKSPADIANYAFARMGFKLRSGSLNDGSEHSATMLELYGQVRDEMLREFDYDFSQATLSLGAPLKLAPPGGDYTVTPWNPATNPPPGWNFQYLYPDQVIKIRSVKPQPLFNLDADPMYYEFTESNDNFATPPQRVILTNVPNALAVYTRRVTDPSAWDVAFTGALAARLMALAAPSLVGLESSKILLPEAAMSTMTSRQDEV